MSHSLGDGMAASFSWLGSIHQEVLEQGAGLFFRRLRPPQALHPGAPRLGFEPRRALAAARFGGAPRPRRRRRAADEVEEPLQRVGAIAFAGAKAPGGDYDDAIARHAPAAETLEARAGFRIERRRSIDIEAQLDRRRDLVDVLAAGPRGADKV